MGNRRLSRKRLFQVEKFGQAVDLGAAPGIKDAIVSATQHRNGAEIITEIAVDLGTSLADITTCGGGSDGDRSPIGVAGAIAYLTQLTVAKFGIVTEVRAILVEALNSTAGSPPAIGIETGTDGDGVVTTADGTGIDGGTRVQLIQDLNVLGEDTAYAADNSANINGTYLYIVQEANDTADVLTAGKVLIYIHGFVAPADI